MAKCPMRYCSNFSPNSAPARSSTPRTWTHKRQPDAGSENLSHSTSTSLILLVGTAKGAFLIYGGNDRSGWAIQGPYCDGWPINHMIGDSEPGPIWAGGGGEWTGAGIWRSDDGGAS